MLDDVVKLFSSHPFWAVLIVAAVIGIGIGGFVFGRHRSGAARFGEYLKRQTDPAIKSLCDTYGLTGNEIGFDDAVRSVMGSNGPNKDIAVATLGQQYGAYLKWSSADSFDVVSLAVLALATVLFLSFLGYVLTNERMFSLYISADGGRGLLTFLFGSTTIGVILLIAVSLFWMDKNEIEERFGKSKDLLAIVISVLGTILGFYYGTASASGDKTGPFALTITKPPPPDSQAPVSIEGFITGGAAPYTVELKASKIIPNEEYDVSKLNVKPDTKAQNFSVTLPAPSDLKPGTEAHVGYQLIAKDKANVTFTTGIGVVEFKPKP